MQWQRHYFMKTGFFTGRFQPFHLGHLSAVRQALRKVDKLYIGIGSSQYNNQPLHPFTVEDRMEIIKRALDENDIKNDQYEIIDVPDIHDDDAWPAYVQTLVPPFDIVFVGDDGIVKQLFEKQTDIPDKMVNREVDISATRIREAMIKKEDWKRFVSKSTAEYLEEIGGVEKIKNINK